MFFIGFFVVFMFLLNLYYIGLYYIGLMASYCFFSRANKLECVCVYFEGEGKSLNFFVDIFSAERV